MGIIASQAVWNTFFTYLGLGLGFLNMVVLYPRVLASDEFGLTRLLVSVSMLTAQVAQLGAENTVVRYFPYFRDERTGHRGLLGMLLLFGGVASTVAALVLIVLQVPLSFAFHDGNALYARFGLWVLPLVCSEIYFILLRSYSRSLLRSVQPTVIKEFQLRMLQCLLILVQLGWPMPFAWFVALYVGTFLVCTATLVVDLRRAGHWRTAWAQRRLPERLRRSMAWYSGFTLSGTVAGMVLGNLDQLMIGALLKDGLRYVAYYAVGFAFGSVIAAPARALAQTAAPLLADAWKRGDRTLIQSVYRRSATVQSVVSGVLYVMLIAGVDELFALLPIEYRSALPVALVVGAAYLITSSIGLSGSIISMSKAYHMDAWTSVIVLAINAVLGFFLIRSMGFVGAAWATLVSLLVVNVYRTWFLFSRFALWPFDVRILGLGIAIPLLGAGVRVLDLTDRPIIDLCLRAFLSGTVFLLFAKGLGLLGELEATLAVLHSRGRKGKDQQA
ncbi:MAG TPA: polysaccharide biosynthesis C-terminal domain-containing protein [Flavobacteriales bacterium]